MYIVYMSNKELRQASADEFVTVEEASELLGLKTGSLRNYLSVGLFSTYKFKTLTLLKLDEVKRWIEKQKRRREILLKLSH